MTSSRYNGTAAMTISVCLISVCNQKRESFSQSNIFADMYFVFSGSVALIAFVILDPLQYVSRLFFRLHNEHIIGSNKNMELQVEVSNVGEDAFEAKFKLKLEQNLRFVKLKEERSTWIANTNKEGDTAAIANMLCSPPDKNNGWTLECNLGNPMLAGNKVGRPSISIHVNVFIHEATPFLFV